jgi:hypothetical protein
MRRPVSAIVCWIGAVLCWYSVLARPPRDFTFTWIGLAVCLIGAVLAV